MNRRGRTVLAIIVAPPAAGAGAGLIFIFFITGISAPNPVPIEPLLYIGLIGGLGAGIVIGVPLMATLGVFVHHMLLRRDWTRWWAYVLAGTLSGFGAMTIAVLLFLVPSGMRTAEVISGVAFYIVSATIGGAVSGGLGWLIRRPDRSEAPPQRPILIETFR